MNHRAARSFITNPAPASSLVPLVLCVSGGFVPAIDHTTRACEFVRFERFTRKVKATAQEALDYAARVIWYRQRAANEKRRRMEIIQPVCWLQAAE